MLFSGKITNSFLVFLERKGVDSGRLYELTDLPTEFLRDSSTWIPAQDVEKFLNSIEREYSASFPEGLANEAGHHCHELRAWGVLDSVIRMMQKPQDLYLQPQRFISYFVSPAPPVANVVRGKDSISFDIPISNQEFPQASEFLRSALEVLPCYLGRDQAQARWTQQRISISWSDSQEPLLKEADLSQNFKPELVQNLMQALEEAQRQVEDLRKQVVENAGGLQAPQSLESEFVQGLRTYVVRTRGHMMRLTDYLVRSQQLVTLLIGQGRMDRQVQEAMKRVDWNYVKSQSTHVAQEVADLLTEFEQELNQRVKPRSGLRAQQPSLDLELNP